MASARVSGLLWNGLTGEGQGISGQLRVMAGGRGARMGGERQLSATGWADVISGYSAARVAGTRRRSGRTASDGDKESSDTNVGL